MAPIKFEEHIKEKLDQREIQPSAGSWEKLNSQLDNSNKGSGNKWWFSAAAAVAVLLIASVLFINQQNQISNPIVETPSENYDKSDNIQFEQPVELVSEETKEENKSTIQLSAEAPAQEKTSKAQIVKNDGESLALNTSENKESIEPVLIEPSVLKTQKEIQISEELKGILAGVSEIEKGKATVSNAEVDALLAEATAEIREKRPLLNSDNITADALLADVEEEMYESFKEKVFEIVKTGYEKAAVAVSNKLDNNQ